MPTVERTPVAANERPLVMAAAPSQAQGQYSADGKWWWNGRQWVVVQAMVTGPTAMVATKQGEKHLVLWLGLAALACFILSFVLAAPFGGGATVFFWALTIVCVIGSVIVQLQRKSRHGTPSS